MRNNDLQVKHLLRTGFVFFSVCLLSLASSFGQGVILSSVDTARIDERAKLLQERTDIRFEFQLTSNLSQEVYYGPGQQKVVLLLDLPSKQGRILSNLQGELVNSRYFDRLLIQYVNPAFQANTLSTSIVWMISDIEKAYMDEKVLGKPKPQEDESTWSLEFLIVCFFLAFVGVAYVVKSIHKVSQPTNKAEYWQYYGYSRLNSTQKVMVWSVVIVPLPVFIYQFVYYYEDIIPLLFMLAFVARPLALFGGYITKIAQDHFLIKETEIDSPSFLSLGQKMYVLNPSLHTEEYILLDIYEMLICKDLTITSELKDPSRPDHYRNFLSLNVDSKKSKHSSFQKLILGIFPRDKEQYFLVHTFIDRVMEEVMNYKVYKKDYMTWDLVKQGFLSPNDWIHNEFKLTDQGEKYKSHLSKKVREARIGLEEYLYGSGELNSEDLSNEMLLISKSEKKVDLLYNRLLENHRYEEGRNSKLGVILEPSFSFWEYRAAIKKQIMESYQARASDWLDD